MAWFYCWDKRVRWKNL